MDRKGTQSFFFKGVPPMVGWLLLIATVVLIAGIVFKMAQQVWLSP